MTKKSLNFTNLYFVEEGIKYMIHGEVSGSSPRMMKNEAVNDDKNGGLIR